MTDKRKGCPMRHENGNCTVAGGFCTAVNGQICEALHNAFDCGYRSAIRQEDHFREATKKVEPLTLDELRQMPIRDWVWIDVLHSKEAVSSYYRKYDGYKKDEIFWCGYPGLGFRFFYEDYGKTWLAYRQQPAEDDHDERKENENV